MTTRLKDACPPNATAGWGLRLAAFLILSVPFFSTVERIHRKAAETLREYLTTGDIKDTDPYGD